MRNLLCLFALLATPAHAAASFDDLRALVLARDFAGTDAALAQAHTEYTAASTPDAERNLYNVFALTDPAIQQFALDWPQNQPDNPRALTAKAWNLYSWGNILRGNRTANHTSAEAMQALHAHHTAAFALFEKAAKLAPDLIPASDGLLRLTATLGNKSLIPIELERIMTSQPNRGSLMRAMVSLAPQWGGRPEQVNLLCDRYAPLISDVKDYTPEVCRIDAVYYANFWQGDQREAAHQRLMFIPNPILDYARHTDMMDGLLTPEETLAALQKLKAERPLDLDEAQKLDWTLINLNKVAPNDAKFPEYAAALLREIPLGEVALVSDPLNPDYIHRYIAVLYDAEEYAGRPVSAADKAEMIRRLQTTLNAVPTDPRLWTDLANLTLRWQDLDSIATSEPYFHNAVYYSNYGQDELGDSIRPKVQMVQDQTNYMHAQDIAGLTPEQLAKLDAVVHCPLVAQLTIIAVVCQNRGIPGNQCAEGAADNKVIIDRLRTRLDAGACNAVLDHGVRDWYSVPAKVDF